MKYSSNNANHKEKEREKKNNASLLIDGSIVDILSLIKQVVTGQKKKSLSNSFHVNNRQEE